MAAKQGLSAQISQASDDARRAVLSRAPTSIKSSWLANLNTTCTIKSAPPRTPEVMGMLATKCGWLVKRNEQHIWQRRWCCVVPHTFLYYFEAEPILDSEEDADGAWDYQEREGFSGGGLYRTAGTAAVENQDLLNAAVKDGIRTRSGNNNTSSDRYADTAGDDAFTSPIVVAPIRGPTVSSANLAPVGIIDLECYTSVNRSSKHDCVFELAGDPKTNPDLRSFYFQAASVEDCEIWTRAMLSDRHCALRDEREAYRQVCESFQLQLQHLSDLIDSAEGKADSSDREVYTLRSTLEQTRKKVMDQIRESLDRKVWKAKENQTDVSSSSSKHKMDQFLENKRLGFIKSIDSMSNGSLTATQAINSSVNTLVEYLNAIMTSYSEVVLEVGKMETTLNQTANIDKASLSDLKLQLEKMESGIEMERKQYLHRISELETRVTESQRIVEDSEKQLQTQLMEFTMFQSSAKTKLQELSQHKKLLKKEVIDMRKKMDEIGSERDAALHARETLRLQIETANHKNKTLEKYIAKLENQVNVQQNIMEVMSTGISLDNGSRGSLRGSSSIVGKTVGPDVGDNGSITSEGNPRMQIKKSQRLPPSTVQGGYHSSKHQSFHEKNNSFISTDFSSIPSTPGGNIHHTMEASLDTTFPASPLPNEVSRRRRNSKEMDNHELTEDSVQNQIDESYLKTADTQHSEDVKSSSYSSHKVPPSFPLYDESEMDPVVDNIVASSGGILESGPLSNVKRSLADYIMNSENTYKTSEMIGSQIDDQQSDDDSKSHISELTEDRTLKSIDSAALWRKKVTSSRIRESDPIPIIYSNEIRDLSESAHKDNRPSRATVEDENDNAHVPTKESSEKNNNNFQSRFMNQTSDELSTSMLSEASKLSIAQRARKEAENPNIHSIQLSQIMREKSDDLDGTSSHHGSFVSNRSLDDRNSSVVKNMLSKLSVRLMLEASDSSNANTSKATNPSSGSVAERNKNDDTVTSGASRDSSPSRKTDETSLTLQQRMQLQRERQREVLRQKGILKE